MNSNVSNIVPSDNTELDTIKSNKKKVNTIKIMKIKKKGTID